ncbi:alanine/ornithine racemase family PLP-dependent enzyme [Billgrantia montanilacus]|uniref:Alanine/ornithine racemase family PLP-dependent enzyme n=1 Tax=Billgrantia montanilacus TaxID=2282305 RepID=A0A368TSN7_9GAMM|nr:alanine/ornithine racemase family PLP-dependent enzyme [Halomonas montanilacus]RCV86213.1 alanine/ornithine racemase family PLP-dependent enzyme [Halomonas montanilacus]
MTCPRVEIDLDKIEENARALVTLLSGRGIDVTGVTKATLGSPEVAKAMIAGGVVRLGDSRLENLEILRAAGIQAPLTLLRSPTPDQADRAVACASISQVSEIEVVKALSAAAGRLGGSHGVVLMVELGDLREGVLPGDVLDLARHMSRTPHIMLAGLGTNLACRAGVVPSTDNMGELSALVSRLEVELDLHLPIVSGGNSANLQWAIAAPAGRVNDLRLGESILLGCDPLTRKPLHGLHTDAFSLVVPVIESLAKPTAPRGDTGEAAFGVPTPMHERGTIVQTIVSIGRQDVDPEGLTPPLGVSVLAASSDHLVLETQNRLAPGEEIRFGLDYSALLRVMTSPFVVTSFTTTKRHPPSLSPPPSPFLPPVIPPVVNPTPAIP